MKLYVTFTSPYARVARIVVAEKGLGGRVEIIEAKTRTAGSPYYRINPSGRVPYLIDDAGVAMEDSQIICAYLDGLDGKPRLHPSPDPDWSYRRLEARARSMCEGICVWVRAMRLPQNERSPTAQAHEAARSERMADHFEAEMAQPLLQGAPNMAQLVLVAGIDFARTRGMGDLTAGRPKLGAWVTRISAMPSVRATAPP
jgi:glutathione S-transferase